MSVIGKGLLQCDCVIKTMFKIEKETFKTSRYVNFRFLRFVFVVVRRIQYNYGSLLFFEKGNRFL